MTLTTLVEGLAFSEGPRWHQGRLYYSDFYRHVVEAVDVAGSVELIAEVPTQPSGLGWLPDGRLLIVSMLDRKLLVQNKDGSLAQYADLQSIATFNCNDMVVDSKGRAYVGNFGSDIDAKPVKRVPADLALVDTDGSVRVAAEALEFPNGSVITPDGKTLIVAETFAKRLTGFDIAADGSLSNRRVWADLGGHYPDGICLDSELGIWIADPVKNCVVRVLEGGEISRVIETGRPAYACALGGDDLKRLFICTGDAGAAKSSRTGRIETIDVEIASANGS
ncbi:MAG: SMP-30/gluconolactonase/LRE family protein [Pseudomonadales bacterium]|nr:SMP-30/gluconolactonase/LRE family protein [Pseudomonadales bacterium]